MQGITFPRYGSRAQRGGAGSALWLVLFPFPTRYDLGKVSMYYIIGEKLNDVLNRISMTVASSLIVYVALKESSVSFEETFSYNLRSTEMPLVPTIVKTISLSTFGRQD